MIHGEEPEPMTPWFRGFDGEVLLADDNRSFVVSGVFRVVKALEVEVTELPVGLWTDVFKAHLEDEKTMVDSYQNRSTETKVNFLVKFKADAASIVADPQALAKHLKLTRKFYLTNMHLFNPAGVIEKYESAEDIMRSFFATRMALYDTRKRMLETRVAEDLESVDNRLKFVTGVVNGTIKVLGATDREIADSMKKAMIDPKYASALMELPVRSLTLDKINRLEKEKLAMETKRAEISSKGPKDLWLADLDVVDKLFGVS